MRWGVFIISLFLISPIVMAGDIKAIVNDTPISAFDVDARAKMIMMQQTGHVEEVTSEQRAEALEDLIDERIKMQEARRLNISVSDAEVAEALAHLEQQNGLEAGGFQTLLAEQGIPYQTLVDQTAANLGWLRVMQQSGRATAVTAADIRARQKAIRQELGRESLSFAEIVMATEEEAQAIWQRLQDGADFGTMVALHSIADSRVNGGRVSHVTRDYYGSEVADVLDRMQIGQLSRPIRVPEGFALILMLNKREAVTGDTVTIWEVTQAIIPADNPVNKQLKQPLSNGCESFRQLVQTVAVPGTFQFGQISPNQIPPDIAPMLMTASLNEVVGPVQTPAGLLYLMKCAERERQLMPTNEEIQNQIEAEKMELLSRQLLSELKRDVVIEYK